MRNKQGNSQAGGITSLGGNFFGYCHKTRGILLPVLGLRELGRGVKHMRCRETGQDGTGTKNGFGNSGDEMSCRRCRRGCWFTSTLSRGHL